MTHEIIIQSVESLKLFSTKNIDKLSGHKNHKSFLEALINIYEANIKNYLAGTSGRVKKLQEVIDYAYSAFYKAGGSNLFFSFVLFIKEQFPDLALSLGLSAEKNELEEHVKLVFVSILSRHLIFSHLAGREFREVCVDPEVQAAQLFPLYLFNAYLLQSQASEHRELIFPSLCGQLFYTSTLLSTTHIPAVLKSEFFAYLDSPEKSTDFIQAVVAGFVQKNSEEMCKARIEAFSQKVLTGEVSAICAPTLAFVGIKVNSTVEEIVRTRLIELNDALRAIEDNKSAIDREAARLRGEAADQADAIRNRPTVWTVGFGTPSTGPGVTLKF
jgi:hypothetical protein